LEGRSSNTEHLIEARKNKKAQKRRKEEQGGPDDPEYGAGKH
jgi:hypothetical protein